MAANAIKALNSMALTGGQEHLYTDKFVKVVLELQLNDSQMSKSLGFL